MASSSPFLQLQQKQHLGLASLIALVAAVLLGYGGTRWWKSGIEEGIDGPRDQEAVSSSAAAMVESFRAVCEGLGPWGLPLYVLFHALLISFCLPYALILEAGAAYLFGFLRGILCVFCAKVLAASLSFWIGRALFRNSTWARTWVQNNKYFRVIAKGVAQDGWKFVLLARFSPMPSYIVNYSLAATDVRYFVDFLMPSILGCVPMILQNTSIGSLTKAATSSVVDGGEKKAGIGAYILPLVGVISSLLIAWRIKKYTSNQVVLTSKSLSSSSMSSTDVTE